MFYLKHEIVLIVVLLAPDFVVLRGMVYNWHNYLCKLLNTGGD